MATPNKTPNDSGRKSLIAHVDSDRPLIVASGVAGLAGPGQVSTEKTVIPADFPFPRVSEQTALAAQLEFPAAQGDPSLETTTLDALAEIAKEFGLTRPQEFGKFEGPYRREARNQGKISGIKSILSQKP
jgi:hypothetical protein